MTAEPLCSECGTPVGPYPHTDPTTGQDRCETHCPLCTHNPCPIHLCVRYCPDYDPDKDQP